MAHCVFTIYQYVRIYIFLDWVTIQYPVLFGVDINIYIYKYIYIYIYIYIALPFVNNIFFFADLSNKYSIKTCIIPTVNIDNCARDEIWDIGFGDYKIGGYQFQK